MPTGLETDTDTDTDTDKADTDTDIDTDTDTVYEVEVTPLFKWSNRFPPPPNLLKSMSPG